MILALFECGLIFAATCAAVHFGSGPHTGGAAPVATALERALALSLSCAAAFHSQRLYDRHAVRTFRAFLARLPISGAMAFVLTLALWRMIQPVPLPFLTPILVLATILGILLPLRALLYGIAARRPFARRNLVIGTGPIARRILHELASRPGGRDVLTGIVSESRDALPPRTSAPILGTLEDLDGILSRGAIDRIVVALEDRRGRLPVQRLLEARVRGIAVEDGEEVLERLSGKIAIESVTPGALAFSREFRASQTHDRLARAASLLIACAGLLVSFPLLLLIPLLIRLESRGPILFVHDRIGLGGRRFGLLKFRTMRPAGGATSEWVRDNEDRITRVGRWLRRFRLDELPQFVNILRGDLNLIGPRPHPASNFDLFGRIVPYYWLRSLVRPGVTGWAQVRYGYANNLEEETEKMRYDLYYIKHRSALLDLRILLETAGVVLMGRGAESAGTTPAADGPERDPGRAVAVLPHLLLRRDAARAFAGRGGAAPRAFRDEHLTAPGRRTPAPARR